MRREFWLGTRIIGFWNVFLSLNILILEMNEKVLLTLFSLNMPGGESGERVRWLEWLEDVWRLALVFDLEGNHLTLQ